MLTKYEREAGTITGLAVHPSFELLYTKTTRACYVHYVADFLYDDANGWRVIEDVKGVKTAMYRLKKRMMKEIYDVDVVEV